MDFDCWTLCIQVNDKRKVYSNNSSNNTERWQYFSDTTGPNIRKGQRVITKHYQKHKEKGPPQLLGVVLICKSNGEERRALKRIIAFKYSYIVFVLFIFFTSNQYFCQTLLCWIVASALLSSTMQNAHFHLVMRLIRAFSEGFEHLQITRG